MSIIDNDDNDDDDDDDDDDDAGDDDNGEKDVDGRACRSNFRDPEVLPLLLLPLLVPPLELLLLVVVPVPLEDEEEEEVEPTVPRVPFFCCVMTMIATMMPMTTSTVMIIQHCFLRMDFWISIASATSDSSSNNNSSITAATTIVTAITARVDRK